MVCSAGCNRDQVSPRYETLTGVVTLWSADAGELTVRVNAPSASPSERTCIVTKDSEVYVNDRLAGPDSIAVGDAVSVIGYRNAAARDDRVVVSTARLERPLPPPSRPDFLADASADVQPAGAAP